MTADIHTGAGGAGPLQGQPGYININDQIASQPARQAALGIILDTLEKSFVDLQGNIKLYQSQAGKPSLPALAVSTGTIQNTLTDSSQQQETLAELIAQLPQILQDKLGLNSVKQEGQSDPNLDAFNMFLGTLAKVLVAIRGFPGVDETQGTQKALGPENITPATTPQELGSQVVASMALGAQSAVKMAGTSLSKIATNPTTTQQLTDAQNTLEDDFAALQNSDGTMSMKDFLTIMNKCLADAKSFLSLVQQMDSEKQADLAAAQRSAGEDRLQQVQENIQKAQEQRAKAAEISLIMKIFTPIVAVIMAVISVVTLGAATPAAIAVTSTMVAATVALSIADSCTGFMSNGMQAVMAQFMSACKDLAKLMGAPEWVGTVIQYYALAAMVAAMMVAAAGGGSAAGSAVTSEVANTAASTAIQESVSSVAMEMATQAGEQGAVDTFKEAAKEQIMKQSVEMVQKQFMTMGITFSTQMVAASNFIADNISAAIKKMHVTDDNTAEMIGKIMQMIVLLMASLMALYSVGSSGSANASKFVKGASETAQFAVTTASVATKLAEVGVNIYVGVQKLKLAQLDIDRGNIQACITVLKQVLESFGISQENLRQDIDANNKQKEALGELWTNLVQGLSQATTALTNINTAG